MKQLTGAQELLLAASSAGVDVCFANPGTSEMWFVSALDAVPSIRPVLGLHETVCSGACDGYARIARKPALSLLHLGPGLANAVANLHNARRARSPVLALIGDQASWHAAADPLLCMDIEALAGTVSGSVIRVSDPAEMVPAVRRALEACRSGGAGGAGNSASTPDSAAVITAADEGVYTARSYNPASPRDVVPISRQSLAPGSRVATIIVPHDFSWEALPASSGSAAAPAAAAAEAAEDPDALLPALNGGSRSSPAPRARRDAADSDRRRYYRTGDVFADGLLRRSGGARRFIKVRCG